MDQSSPRRVNEKSVTVRVNGHFGELVQGTLDGRVVLVTLPSPRVGSVARFSPGRGGLTTGRTDAPRAYRAARQLLSRLSPHLGGALSLRRIGEPGTGTGSSTSDILACLRAVAVGIGRDMSPEEEAALCLEAEMAVDPLMIPGTVVFASREGRVIERLPPLPRLRIVGAIAGPGRATLSSGAAFADVRPALDLLRMGLESGDLAAIGRAATLSAAAHQEIAPCAAWPVLQAIAAETGALGIALAHTGSAVALVLAPDTDPGAAEAGLRRSGLSPIVFDTGGQGAN